MGSTDGPPKGKVFVGGVEEGIRTLRQGYGWVSRGLPPLPPPGTPPRVGWVDKVTDGVTGVETAPTAPKRVI